MRQNGAVVNNCVAFAAATALLQNWACTHALNSHTHRSRIHSFAHPHIYACTDYLATFDDQVLDLKDAVDFVVAFDSTELPESAEIQNLLDSLDAVIQS
jgi:hypothetical protein